MQFPGLQHVVLTGVAGMLAVVLTGCTQQTGSSGNTGQVSELPAAENDHQGWWCTEHGIPEEQCSLCSSTAAAKFREQGDWCDEHQRAASQCFACDPTRAEKYAQLYEAKFGHAPPAPTE